MVAAYLAIELQFNGSCKCPVTACASGTDAIGEAFHSIRDGYLDVVLCGGAEAGINPLAIGGFASMKALSTSKDPKRASIPFDKERSGFVMGEGAGILVLEELGHALERGAKIYAEIIGYGSTCDAGHITQPSPGGELAFRAMEMALEDGGLSPEDLDYINAHGTSTALNDKTETQAIKKLLGEHVKDVFVSSSKSMMGHLLGASGAVEAIVTLVAMDQGILPANVGYKVADEECDLNLVLEPRNYEFKTAMSNSFGFGGHNASILFRKWEDSEI
jgi:3-oxoacyl-[acyl-carrier-protein] synthase II